MISGDATARTYDNTTLTYLNTRPIADRTSFACIDYNHPSPETPSMTNTNCPDGLRAQIQFQSCWDGVNAYFPESAHVAYMSQIDNGVCPPTHPVPIPHLFFEVYYSVDAFNGMDGKFVFANGDETGYSFHGDFMSGWDADVLAAGVKSCLTGDDNASGVTKDCAAFVPSIDEKFADGCVAAEPIFGEEVDGLLMSLPGCNPLSDGPDGPKSVWCKVGGNGTVAAASVWMGWNASTSALPAAATAAVADPLTTNDGSAMTMTADDSAAAAAATTAAVSLTASISDADSDASFPTAAPSAIASSTASSSDDDATAAASSTADIFSQLASALPAASSTAAVTTTDNASSAATDAAAATNTPAAATSSIDPSAACSMYSNLSVVGCSSAVAPATTEYAATTTVMADADWSAADMSVITTLVTLTISV